jgi:hypothetical protein
MAVVQGPDGSSPFNLSGVEMQNNTGAASRRETTDGKAT